jgi:hypothetical protein
MLCHHWQVPLLLLLLLLLCECLQQVEPAGR